MRLKWFPVGCTGQLHAKHPVFHDEGSDLFYELVCLDLERGLWALKFESAILHEGALANVLKAAERNARETTLTYRIARLREDIGRQERSLGGSWRRLKSIQSRRELLRRLESKR